jgi:hypothetical protein
MLHSYDFTLITRMPPADPARLEEALLARGAVALAEGGWRWPLAAVELQVGLLRNEGALVGLDLRVPISSAEAPVRAAFSAARELAEALGLRFVDPQLSRDVTAADEPAVLDAWARTARYAGEYLGVGEALSTSPLVTGQEGLNASTRVTLALLVFAFAGFMAFKWATAHAEPVEAHGAKNSTVPR